MKAILCSQYCGPDDLVLADIPDPVAAPGEIVIRIKAAALNFFDLLMIHGKYQIKPPFPFSPAAEVAGVVESLGEGVIDIKVGDRVVASCGHNGAREKIAVPALAAVKTPDGLDDDRAAGIIIIHWKIAPSRSRARRSRCWVPLAAPGLRPASSAACSG